MKTINIQAMKGKRATDNVRWRNKTYRISVEYRPTDPTVRLAPTNRGAELVGDFEPYFIRSEDMQRRQRETNSAKKNAKKKGDEE